MERKQFKSDMLLKENQRGSSLRHVAQLRFWLCSDLTGGVLAVERQSSWFLNVILGWVIQVPVVRCICAPWTNACLSTSVITTLLGLALKLLSFTSSVVSDLAQTAHTLNATQLFLPCIRNQQSRLAVSFSKHTRNFRDLFAQSSTVPSEKVCVRPSTTLAHCPPQCKL